MKTKHILTALALPAMFAACTADDIVSVDNGLQQDQRAKLSKDFVLNTSSEVDSRYAVEGSTALEFNFEKGDRIGANLIDVFDEIEEENQPEGYEFNAEDPATWKIVPYVAPALPFENDGEDIWKSAGELGIGNYLFTNPYNPDDKNRAAAKFELPIVVQYSSETPNAHIEDYNKAVATSVLRKGDTEATINLKNLYTYPKILVNFPKADGVTKVTKVVLRRNGGFIYKGSFDHQAIVNMFSEQALETYFAIPANKNKTEADYWAEQQTSAFIIDADEYTEDMYYAQCETTPTLVYEMDEKVTSNKLEVRLMIPSVASLLDLAGKDVDNTDEEDVITVYICTNEGNYKFTLTDINEYTFKETTLAATKDKALWRNKSNTLTVAADKLDVATEEEMDGLVEANIVSTTADWNALVTRYGDLKKYSAAYKEDNKDATGEEKDWEDLVVTIVGDEFALTSDLKMPEIAEFVIESNIAVKGDVTLKNILVRKATSATATPVVTVKEGATLTTNQTFKAPIVNVEKGAALKVTAAYNNDEELIAYDGIQKVVNAGEVTVVSGAEATFNLQNNMSTSKLYVGAAAASRAVGTDAVLNLVNYVKAADTFEESNNYGEVYNYGVLNVDSTFTSYAPSVTAGYKKNKDGEWIGMSRITNEGTFNAKGVVKNYTEFVQNKNLSSNFAEGKFYNYGRMTIKAGVSTYIDSNNGGRIILSEKKPTDFTIHDAKDASLYEDVDRGTIQYTATTEEIAAGLDMSDSPVTYLITNGDVELKKTFTYTAVGADDATICALDSLVINGGDVKISGKTEVSGNTVPAPAKVEKLIIASGKATISSKINSVSKVHVAENATLEIMEATGELILEYLSDVTFGEGDATKGDKKGVMYVNGKMHLTVEKGANSKVALTETEKEYIKTGKEVDITCQSDAYSPTDAETETYNKALKEYKEALVAAVKYWAEYSYVGNEKSTINNLGFNLKDTTTGYNGSTTNKGAKFHFETFISYENVSEATELTTKYNALTAAYLAKTNTKTLDNTWSIGKEYTAAVDTLIARNKEIAVKSATWSVETSTAAAHIYNAASYTGDDIDGRYDTSTTVLESWTPAQKALADFVDEVKKTSGSKISVNGMNANLYKAVVITGSTTSEILAPKYSQVFKSDVIYKIFGKDAIGYTRNWFTYGKLTKAYNKNSDWNNALVKSWINEVAQAAAGNGYVDKAKAFLTTNSVLDIFQDWNYNADIVASLAAQLLPEAEGNDSDAVAVSLPEI